MDEPFLGKDIFTRNDFLKLMIAILEPNECAIIATHQVEEIEMFVTRAIVMHKGKVVADTKMETLQAQGQNLTGLIQSSCGYDEERVMEFFTQE